MSQMPTEGRRFKMVDVVWRKIMVKLAKNADALTVGGDEDIMKQLQDSNKDLEFVTSGLNEYLETKRLAFPRWVLVIELFAFAIKFEFRNQLMEKMALLKEIRGHFMYS